MNRHIFLLIAVLSFVVGCEKTNYGEQRDNRTAEWHKMINEEIPVGTEVKKVEEWFANKGYKTIPDLLKQDENLTLNLESFPADEWFCDKWFITIKVIVVENKVSNYKYSASGVCL